MFGFYYSKGWFNMGNRFEDWRFRLVSGFCSDGLGYRLLLDRNFGNGLGISRFLLFFVTKTLFL